MNNDGDNKLTPFVRWFKEEEAKLAEKNALKKCRNNKTKRIHSRR